MYRGEAIWCLYFPSGLFYHSSSDLATTAGRSSDCFAPALTMLQFAEFAKLQNCLRNAQLCLKHNTNCAIGQKFSLKRNANIAICQKFSLKRNTNCAKSKKNFKA